jgi:hypothetical protein
MSAPRFKLTIQEPSESDLLHDALAWLSYQPDLTTWRCNSGTVFMSGRVFHGSPKGTPDVLGYSRSGAMLAWELKRHSGKLRPEQVAWLNRARDCGVWCDVVRSLDELKLSVRKLRAVERAKMRLMTRGQEAEKEGTNA